VKKNVKIFLHNPPNIMNREQFKAIRKAKAWTQETMAAELGCSTSAVVKYEHGDRPIPHWVCEKLLKSMDVTISFENLSVLIEHASFSGEGFNHFLSRVVRDYAQKLRPKTLRIAESAPEYCKPNPTQPS
jgi:DNA-binding XRE family transcriptional regulator